MKKAIIDSLYKSDFYQALNDIKTLENEIGQEEEVFIFYYFLYDLMEWVCNHKKDKNVDQIIDLKEKYFNKVNQQNQYNKSLTYLKLYMFLEENFRTFERYTWFRKKDKSINLLNQAIIENPNNLEAQFYMLFCEEKTKECFEFLNVNTLNAEIVQKLLNKVSLQHDFLDNSKQLKEIYKIDNSYSDFIYYAKKEDYEWLYKYFNDNKEEKNKSKYISFGKVCFELEKYDEAIEFYENKENKNNRDYYELGECYEKEGEKQQAIECYQNYYANFKSGYWKDGIEKLFRLKAYDEIKEILKNEKSHMHKKYKIFYEAKLLSFEKKYDDSINQLNGALDSLNDYDLKRDIYLLFISNYYKKTIDFLNISYSGIIKNTNFELNDFYGLGYNHYAVFQELEKYIKKLNIEYDNKYYKATERCKNRIHNRYIALNKMLYNEAKKIKFQLTEDRTLYYLSAFDDLDSLDQRIKVYEKKINNELENPKYYLELGRLHYTLADRTNKDFTLAIENLKKSIELAQKYFINLDGRPELLLVQINQNTTEKKQFFDASLKNFIFYNSYQKDTTTTFFEQILYKYQSFSINALSSLANDYLYFASPDKLNDPFDVASESLEKQFENLALNKTDFKTCSLSKNNNNKLMWAHYSNEHTGLCVGYKFLYLPNYVGKDEVRYRNTNLNEKDIFESIIDYWTVKSEDWEYEQEVRLLHYGEQEKIPYTFDPEQAYKENMIALQIHSITLGLKFEDKKIIKQAIQEIENKQKSKINIFQTKITEQKLEIEKIIL